MNLDRVGLVSTPAGESLPSSRCIHSDEFRRSPTQLVVSE
jgi:hypothetical protein